MISTAKMCCKSKQVGMSSVSRPWMSMLSISTGMSSGPQVQKQQSSPHHSRNARYASGNAGAAARSRARMRVSPATCIFILG